MVYRLLVLTLDEEESTAFGPEGGGIGEYLIGKFEERTILHVASTIPSMAVFHHLLYLTDHLRLNSLELLLLLVQFQHFSNVPHLLIIHLTLLPRDKLDPINGKIILHFTKSQFVIPLDCCILILKLHHSQLQLLLLAYLFLQLANPHLQGFLFLPLLGPKEVELFIMKLLDLT